MNIFATLTPEAWHMLGMVCGLFVAAKILVLLQWRLMEAGRFRNGREAAWFWMPWPGMNPGAMLRRGAMDPRWLWQGLLAVMAGLLLLTAAHGVMTAGGSRWWAAVLLMPGFSLLLHFGVFTLLAAGYRHMGFGVARPFGNPLRTRSLDEFWGRLWNRPFTELTVRLVLRPLRALGLKNRTMLAGTGFALSGVLHELAITVPADAGYGGPMLYFLIQGMGWILEKQTGWHHRLFTWLWILLPLPLVFPQEFVFRVMFPLAGLTAGGGP